MGIFRKIRNIKDTIRKEQKLLTNKVMQLLDDERYFDTTYILYDHGVFSLESLENVIKNICSRRGFSYEKKAYPYKCIFYVYVKKLKEPKYNVGDVVQVSDKETGMITYRKRGKNDWYYTIAGITDIISESTLSKISITK